MAASRQGLGAALGTWMQPGGLDARALPTPEAGIERWRTLWQSLFEPLRLELLSSEQTLAIQSAQALHPGKQAWALPAGRLLIACPPDSLSQLPVEPTSPVPAAWLLQPRSSNPGYGFWDAELAQTLLRLLPKATSATSSCAQSLAYRQGQEEERLRLAQDLHDDLGARLLSMLCLARDPQLERLIRMALQDLKTLTRGLAKSDCTLRHATAEWRHELMQRTSLARCSLHWQVDMEGDYPLDAPRWSALSRVLRELVNNALAHGQAKNLDICISLQREGQQDASLLLRVSDDGLGGEPSTWSAGLGVSGVRRRARQLGAQVHWQRKQPNGIECTLRIPLPGNTAPVVPTSTHDSH